MVSGMQQVLRATDLFRRSPRTTDWPRFDDLGHVPESIDDMRAMTSTERKELLRRCGVPMAAMPLFLRSIQSLAVLNLHENVNKPSEDRPMLHPYRSATEWNPLIPHGSVLAPSIVLAAEPMSAYMVDDEVPLESIGSLAAGGGGAASSTTALLNSSSGALSTTADRAPQHQQHGPPPYPGLLNQGSTCYLNSILQALFHLGSFRAAIMAIPTEEVVEPTASIPLALQRLFYGMAMQSDGSSSSSAQHGGSSNDLLGRNGTTNTTGTAGGLGGASIQHTAQTTNELTRSFGWTEQDAFIQHDAHELTRKLIDNMEEAVAKKIKDGSMSAHPSGSPTNKASGGASFSDETTSTGAETSTAATDSAAAAPTATTSAAAAATAAINNSHNGNIIRELFTGTMENYVDVKDVNYRSASNQIFYELQLVVKNHKHIYSSLNALLEPNVLEGKNKYCLERNGSKSYHDAKTGCQFVSFPPVLMLHLARFDYDPYKDEMVKVSTRYEYYEELDLSRFTPKMDRGHCQYQLHAVLVHNGRTATFGHYFCYVRCGDRWVKFNDEQVTYASRSEVFGENFGGFTLNHWGAEVAQTKSAYMLVYVRKPAAELLRGPSEEAIPEHLKVRYRRELEAKERLEREQREAHLYTKVHFITQADLADHHQLLRLQHPTTLTFPQRRTLRVENTANAMEAFQKYVTESLFYDGSRCTFWYVSEESGYGRLAKHLKPDVYVGSIAKGREMCVLFIPPREFGVRDSTRNRRGDSVLGGGGGNGNPDDLPEPMALEDFIAANAAAEHNTSTTGSAAVNDTSVTEVESPLSPAPPGDPLPDPSLLTNPIVTHHYLYNPNNLKESYMQSLVVPHPFDTTDDAEVGAEASSPRLTAEGRKLLVKNRPKTVADMLQFLDRHNELMPCVVFAHTGDYTVADVSNDAPKSGAHYYWQLESTSAFLRLYPTYDHFQEFLRTRTLVELKHVAPPYNTVCKGERLSLKMPYEFVQRYFAILLNEANFDKLRFSRHNPETNGPFFMKIKKNKGTTLESLLMASKKISKVLYYEVLEKFTVTEIESANPLSFDLFNAQCQYVSTHMILMPPPSDFTHATLLRSCLSEVGSPMDDAPLYHLLDIWRGRIYGCYPFDQHAKLNKAFEESAEYRLERAPKPIDGVPRTRQIKVPVSHYHLVSPNNKVTTHGDPFYLYVSLDDTLEDLRGRIQRYLNVSEQAIQDWRLRLVVGEKVVPVVPTSLVGDQIEAFLKGKSFEVVESDPLMTPFLGLEHAPSLQRRGGPARTNGNELKIGN